VANCERLGEMRLAGDIRELRYALVVKLANFREMPAFAALAKKLGGDRACFSRLVDWGTWPRREFEQQCVWREDHPLYAEFMQVMADPALEQDWVDFGNMTSYRRQALHRGLGQSESFTI
jgi:hypothetical protein